MGKVVVFIGTRPEAIKLAPVVHALTRSSALEPVVVSTGQHREMLAQSAGALGLRFDHELNVMRHNQTLAGLTSRLIAAIDQTLDQLSPDFALVQGDTTTVLAGALACFYRKVPVGHVEAGLRSHDLWSPFPEEANRTLVSRIATAHYAPTKLAREALLREGIAESTVHVTGNTVIDALLAEVERQKDAKIRADIDNELHARLGASWGTRPFVLITGHRRENFGAGFQSICDAIAELARSFDGYDFVYPVHLNPKVNQPVRQRLSALSNVRLIEPVGYAEFVALMNACTLALTDSGGVQEEAPSLGKPVLVMRKETERPEGIDAGVAKLVGTDRDEIVTQTRRLLEDKTAYRKMATSTNPYGDGHAAERIVALIEQARSHA